MRNEARRDYFAAIGTRFEKCLEPTECCDSQPINAHSMQNARIFDLLAEDGHVLMFEIKHVAGSPSVCLDRIGRNKASTFRGLCSKHDEEIFRPIDTSSFDFTNQEHLFLLAYRSVLRELHAVCQAAVRLQLAFQAAVDRGDVRSDIPTPQGMAAVAWIKNAYDCNLFKKKLDSSLLGGQYDVVEHKVLRFNSPFPTIAVSALFSLDDMEWPDDVARIAFNVFPDTQGTNVVFSYLREERSYAIQFLSRILEANGEYQRYLISKTVLQNCENWVIAPAYFNSWGEKKQEVVQSYYCHTMMRNDPDYEDPHLYLF